MRKTLILIALALVAVPAASAGGWATAGISPLPTASNSGGEQTFTITILRHGKTLTDGAAPAIVLSGPGGQKLRFPASPAGEVGKYTATVKWPAAGTWGFAVNDGLEATRYGMSQTHTFNAVTVSGAAGDSGGGLTLPLGLGGALAALVLALAIWRLRDQPTKTVEA
jgi:hypothetical protein